jgi:hypothetical protein
MAPSLQWRVASGQPGEFGLPQSLVFAGERWWRRILGQATGLHPISFGWPAVGSIRSDE